MEFADLVDAGAMSGRWTGGARRWRVLAAFAVGGAALAGLGRVLPGGGQSGAGAGAGVDVGVAGEPHELVVPVARGASRAEIGRAVDEALWVELGVQLGWREDPLITDGIVRALGVLGVAGDRKALLDQAEAFGLLRADPLARARLAERARALYTRVRAPSEAELEATLADEPERFRRPTIVTLRVQEIGASAPELVLGPHPTRSEDQLVRALGQEATAAVMALPVGPETPWSEPIATALGRLRIKVEAKVPGTVPALMAIRTEVEGWWRGARVAVQLGAALERLRAGARVRLEELGP